MQRSVCPHDCPSVCGLLVDIDEGRLRAVRGDPAHGYTQGVVCAKVARYAERLHHPERLTTPLLRHGPKGSGRFRPISWDEALDRIAGAFAEASAKHGGESVWPYHFAGTMGLVQRDGINRLRHALGYSGQANTFCSSIAEAGWRAGAGFCGGPDPREMEAARLVVVWGGNPVATQVNAMIYIARAQKSGAKLVVIDPYRTGTAEKADLHLALRPGTDAALACAVMHVLFRDGHADRAYLARYTDAPERLQAHLHTRSPAWAAAITGLDAQAIEDFAALYGTTRQSYLRLGYGFSRSANGAAAMHAVSCLPAVTGAWQHEGGGAFWSHRDVYHLDRSLIMGTDLRDPAIRTLDMSRIGAVLAGDDAALAGGGPVRAMLIQSTNPAAVAPDAGQVRRGLAREDLFVAVHEHFMTDTARLADVVLPATMFLEHDDLYQGGGHAWLRIGPKLMEPPGECRSNHALVCALAERLGASHPGFAMSEMAMIDATLQRSGWPAAATLLERGGIDVQPGFRESHFLDGFGHSDRRFHFVADWAALGALPGLPALPDHVEPGEPASEAHPYRLVAAPARQFLNSSFSEMATSRAREGRPSVLIPRDEALALGIEEGAPVLLSNARGRVRVHARLADGQASGTLVVESVWPHEAFEGGEGINTLIGDAPAAPRGGAAFHDTAVRLERAA